MQTDEINRFRNHFKGAEVSKKEAVALGFKHYFTGKPCKHGHLCERTANVQNTCLECAKARSSKKRKEFPGNTGLTQAQIDRKNERGRIYGRSEKGKEYRRNYRAKRYTQDPVKFITKAITRTRRVRTATPPWLSEFDKKRIEIIYACRDALNKLGHDNWHVDHIIPIQGKEVCGLHIPSNLRVIKAFDNRSKGNRLEMEG